MSQLILRSPFNRFFAGRDPFQVVDTLKGEVLREINGRRTLRFEVEGASYYIKIHHGVGWFEIIKNILCLRLPVLGARNEWNAVEHLTELGIDTMRVVAFGEKGLNPARLTSFIITEALTPTVSLEDYCRGWAENPPAPALKHALIRRVAEMARTMHCAWINHRDFYLCHFLLHTDPPPTPENFRLSLIDLHRMQIHNAPPAPRWRRKDLSQIYFSAVEAGFSHHDLLRFARVYFDAPLKTTMQQEAYLFAWLKGEVARLQERYRRKFASGDQ